MNLLWTNGVHTPMNDNSVNVTSWRRLLNVITKTRRFITFLRRLVYKIYIKTSQIMNDVKIMCNHKRWISIFWHSSNYERSWSRTKLTWHVWLNSKYERSGSREKLTRASLTLHETHCIHSSMNVKKKKFISKCMQCFTLCTNTANMELGTALNTGRFVWSRSGAQNIKIMNVKIFVLFGFEVGRKREIPEKKTPDHPQAELGLSDMWPELGSNSQRYDDERFRALKISGQGGRPDQRNADFFH